MRANTAQLRPLALASRYREALLLVLALAFGLALGRSVASGQMLLAAALAGLVLVLVLAQRPWLPYAAATALVATFATPSSFPILGMPGNPTLPDLVLGAAFAAWVLALSRPESVNPGSFALAPQLAMGGLTVGILVGTVVGRSNGTDFSYTLVSARDVWYVTTFWLALTAFADPRGRVLLFRLGALAAVAIVAAQVAQGFLGAGTLLFYDNAPLNELLACANGGLCDDPGTSGFPRVRPPGLVIVYVAACFAAAYLLWGPKERRRSVGALLLVCMVGILISQNRNMLIGLAAGLVVAGVLARRRGRFAVAVLTLAVLVVVSLTLARPGNDEPTSGIAARVLTLTEVSDLAGQDTVTERLVENHHALNAIRASPVFGLGWGVPYGNEQQAWQDGQLVFRGNLHVHNQYLALWLRAGILGLVSFLAAIALTLLYGARWLRAAHGVPERAWLGAAVVMSATATAVSAIVGIYVVNPSWAPIIAGLVALATNLRRDLRLDTRLR
jgi:hypothetical protein